MARAVDLAEVALAVEGLQPLAAKVLLMVARGAVAVAVDLAEAPLAGAAEASLAHDSI